MYYLYWIWLIIYVVALWKIFVKAGQEGWKSLIPIYNLYLLLKIVGMSPWWLLALFVPLVNLIVSVVISLSLAKVFGKSSAYGFFMLWLLAFIGMPILGFGDAKYQAPASPPAKPAVPAAA